MAVAVGGGERFPTFPLIHRHHTHNGSIGAAAANGSDRERQHRQSRCCHAAVAATTASDEPGCHITSQTAPSPQKNMPRHSYLALLPRHSCLALLANSSCLALSPRHALLRRMHHHRVNATCSPSDPTIRELQLATWRHVSPGMKAKYREHTTASVAERLACCANGTLYAAMLVSSMFIDRSRPQGLMLLSSALGAAIQPQPAISTQRPWSPLMSMYTRMTRVRVARDCCRAWPACETSRSVWDQTWKTVDGTPRSDPKRAAPS
mmetsp:Transcript_4920/g.14938  ORF Transcript_4920/g.14938 Transcript_4920/m.14938 type:complete len:264 (-) Transcript_4920:362-1153(-)